MAAGTEVGSLYYDLDLKDSKLTQGLASADKKVSSFGDKMSAAWDKSVSASNAFAVGVGAAAVAVVGLGAAGVKSAGEFEQSRIAFETMLGSADKARKMMNDIAKFAKETPFELPEVVAASKQLLAFGFAQEQILPTMRKLGDLAAGLGVPVGQLTNVFGQVRVAGRLMGQDLLQFTNAGVPLIEALAKTMKKPQTEIKKLVEEGKVGFPEVEAALNSLTGEGSKFGGMMEKQSKSFNGIISNLKDGFGEFLRTMVGISNAGDIVAGGLFDRLKQAAEALMPIVQNLPKILGDAFAKLQPYLPQIVGAILGGLVPAFLSLAVSIGASVLALAPWLALGAAIGWLVKLLIDNFGGLDGTIKALQPVIAGFQQVWQAVANVWTMMILPLLRRIWEEFEANLLPSLKRLWEQISPILIPALKALAIIMGAQWLASIMIALGGLYLLIKVVANVVSFLAGLVNTVRNVINWFGNFRNSINSAFNGVAGWLISAGANLVAGLIRGMINQKRAVIDTIIGIARGALDAVKRFFGIKSPSTLMAEQGKYLMEGFAKGIETSAGGAVDAAVDASRNILSGFNGGNLTSQFAVSGRSSAEAVMANNNAPQPQRKGDTVINIGTVEDRQDADYIIREFDRRQELEFMGGTPV
jgi:tape measure domain-containing protein